LRRLWHLDLLLTLRLPICNLWRVIYQQLFTWLLLNHGDDMWRLDSLEWEIVRFVKLPPQVVQLWRVLMRLILHLLGNEMNVLLVSSSIVFLCLRSLLRLLLLLLLQRTLRLLQELLFKLPGFRGQDVLLLRLLGVGVVEIVLIEVTFGHDALLDDFRYLVHEFVLRERVPRPRMLTTGAIALLPLVLTDWLLADEVCPRGPSLWLILISILILTLILSQVFI
jgi:hypothetical protein